MIRKATIVSVSGRWCSVTCDGSSVIKRVPVIGDWSTLEIGREVLLEYIDERPVALIGGATTSYRNEGSGSGGTLAPHAMSYHTDEISWHAGLSGAELHDPKAHASAHEVGGSDTVDHDSLTNFVANEHIDHSAVTLTAGAGLTGGGTIAASRTFNVVGGSGITANADDIALTWGTPVIGTIGPDDAADAGASENPARSDHQHAIAAAAPAVNLSVSSTNAEGAGSNFARSTHSHAITTSSNPGAAASVLASDVSGRLELEGIGIGTAPTGQEIRVDGDIVFVGAQSITTTADDMTLAPAGDLSLSPTGAQVRLMASAQIQSDNYASQTTGWGVSYAGSADFRYVFTDELHAKVFIADLEQALAGGQIISKSVAILSRDFTAPAAEATTTLYVWDLPSAENMAVFETGDIVCLRSFSRAAGTLSITECWGVVTSYSNLADNEQSWTFTRSAAPNAGAMAGAATVSADALVLDYGTTGNGYYEVNAIDGLYGVNSPYSQIVTWETHPATGESVRARLGNLTGVTAVTEYGLYAGDGVAVADSYVLISDVNVEIHNVALSIHDGANTVFKIDPTVPSYALGATVPTDFDTVTGVWAGLHGGSYKWRVGDPAGIRMQWDGAALGIYDGDDDVRFRVDGDGAWLSNLAISSEFGQQYFTNADGLLLLGPSCPLSDTIWESLRGQEATITGAFHTVNGRWPGTQALMVEEATTNLEDNPIFGAANTGGWNSSWGDTVAHQTSGGFVGDDCLRVTAGGGDANAGALEDFTVTAAVPYTFQARIKVDSAWDGSDVYVRMYDGAGFGALLNTSNAIAAGTGWKEITVIGTPTQTTLRMLFFCSGSPTNGEYFEIDAIQLEQKAYPTTLCVGSFAWCAWSGTADASTSTRSVNDVTIHGNEVIDYSLGSIAIWFQMPHDAGTANLSATRGLYRHYDAWNTESFYIGMGSDLSTVGVTCYAGSASQLSLSASLTGSKAGDWHQALVTITDAGAGEVKLYLDGVLEDTDTSYTAPTIANVTGYLGHVTKRLGGAIGEFATFSSVLSTAEAAAIYQSGVPMTDMGASDTPGIYIMDGKFRIASSYTGQRIDITSDEIAGYDSAGTKQFYLQSSDGMAYAGAGKVRLSEGGLALLEGPDTVNRIRWYETDYDGEICASIYSDVGFANKSYLWVISKECDVGAESILILSAIDAGADIRLNIASDGTINAEGCTTFIIADGTRNVFTLTGGEAQHILGDAAGAKSFEILDSATAVAFTVDSDGVGDFASTVRTAADHDWDLGGVNTGTITPDRKIAVEIDGSWYTIAAQNGLV